MYPELTNLLPPERTRLVRRDYFLRLTTVAALVATTLVVIHGTLLLPAYLLLDQNIQSRQTHLANVNATLASSDQTDIEARVSALSEEANQLTTLGKNSSVSSVVANFLVVPHQGISVTALTYKPAALKVPTTLTVTGTARSRDELRQYQLALQSTPLVESVDLPVSAFAKDADIPFVITVSLKTP